MKEPEAVPITLDDLREKALHIRDVAKAEVKHVVEDRTSRAVLIGVVAFAAALSIAYFLGTRRR